MLCHAMVSDKPGGLSVQRPPHPGKLAAQLKSPFGDSCYRTETQADKQILTSANPSLLIVHHV